MKPGAHWQISGDVAGMRCDVKTCDTKSRDVHVMLLSFVATFVVDAQGKLKAMRTAMAHSKEMAMRCDAKKHHPFKILTRMKSLFSN